MKALPFKDLCKATFNNNPIDAATLFRSLLTGKMRKNYASPHQMRKYIAGLVGDGLRVKLTISDLVEYLGAKYETPTFKKRRKAKAPRKP